MIWLTSCACLFWPNFTSVVLLLLCCSVSRIRATFETVVFFTVRNFTYCFICSNSSLWRLVIEVVIRKEEERLVGGNGDVPWIVVICVISFLFCLFQWWFCFSKIPRIQECTRCNYNYVTRNSDGEFPLHVRNYLSVLRPKRSFFRVVLIYLKCFRMCFHCSFIWLRVALSLRATHLFILPHSM